MVNYCRMFLAACMVAVIAGFNSTANAGKAEHPGKPEKAERAENRSPNPSSKSRIDHSPQSVTTTRQALAGADDALNEDLIRIRAWTWCQTKVRGGGRVTRIELLSADRVRCWYKN